MVDQGQSHEIDPDEIDPDEIDQWLPRDDTGGKVIAFFPSTKYQIANG
jgi:hypothetical protein